MQPIHTVNPTILLAIELSASTWLVAARVPGSEKPHLHRIDSGDTAALLALILSLRNRVARRLDAAIGVVCCFEANLSLLPTRRQCSSGKAFGLSVVSVMAVSFSAGLVAFSHLPFSQIRGLPAHLNCAKNSLRHQSVLSLSSEVDWMRCPMSQ